MQWGAVSEGAKTLLEHLPLIMDGVTWDVMSAYEFVNNLNHVALSKPYTQKGSGRFMCDEMENALIEAGCKFCFTMLKLKRLNIWMIHIRLHYPTIRLLMMDIYFYV